MYVQGMYMTFAIDPLAVVRKVLCAMTACLTLLTGWCLMPGSHLEAAESLFPPPDVRRLGSFLE